MGRHFRTQNGKLRSALSDENGRLDGNKTVMEKENPGEMPPTTPNADRSLSRYHLVLPTRMYEEVQHAAALEQTTALEMFRRFISVGLWVYYKLREPNTELFIREGDTEREIKFY